MTDLPLLVSQAESAFAQASTPAELENAKAAYLGKSGRITELMKGLASLPVEQKKPRARPLTKPSRALKRCWPPAARPWPPPNCSASWPLRC
jgi:phenylalanyl-tRNA synthetase alpha chain